MIQVTTPCVFFFFFQVGNLGLLFMLLFFIYAALGVELFGELGKCATQPAHFARHRLPSGRMKTACKVAAAQSFPRPCRICTAENE